MVHDEFSHLLSADTFVRGRLTNPKHDLWEYFETFHVLVRPTYSSKYPPGQGLLLAAGRLVYGHPFAAVALSTVACAVSIAWMIRAWAPWPWATLGGCLVATHQTVVFDWGLSYMGGSLAAIGGALFVRSWATAAPK